MSNIILQGTSNKYRGYMSTAAQDQVAPMQSSTHKLTLEQALFPSHPTIAPLSHFSLFLRRVTSLSREYSVT